jgi:hypothetical protein
MKYYDATKEFTPFDVSKATGQHPRPRTGATKKKRAKEDRKNK